MHIIIIVSNEWKRSTQATFMGALWRVLNRNFTDFDVEFGQVVRSNAAGATQGVFRIEVTIGENEDVDLVERAITRTLNESFIAYPNFLYFRVAHRALVSA